MTRFTESMIEDAALEWPKDMGYAIVFGNEIVLENMVGNLRGGLSMLRVK